jgi:hypothetical protein
MGDPFLNYFALFLLVFVVVVLFHAIIPTRTRSTPPDG